MCVTQAKRTRMSPEARRDQLIALGLRMVSERPLDEVSIDAIAEVAGVSRALLFHYFASKQEFHVAIAKAQGEEMLRLTAPDETLDDPLAILWSSLSAFVDYVSEHRSAYTAFLRGASSTDPAMRAVIDGTRAVMAERILDHAPALGVEVTPAVRLATFGWIAFVEEVTIGWLTDEEITRDHLLALISSSLPALVTTLAALPAR